MANRGESILFWIIIILLLFAAALALGLAFMVLGVDMTNPKNISFSILTIMMFLWFITSIILRWSLYFESGSFDALFGVVATSYAMICPTLLLFTARCFNKNTKLIDASWIILFALSITIAVISETGTIYSTPILDENGYTLSYSLSTLGYALALLYLIPGLFAFIILYKCSSIEDPSRPYMMGGAFLIILGFLIGGLQTIPFPLSPFVFTVSLLLFGYAVLRQQIFNPIREIEEKQRAILDATTEFIILISLDGTIQTLNKAAAERFGKKPEELKGKMITDLLGLKLMEEAPAMIYELTNKRAPIHFQEEINGNMYDTYLYPVYDRKNKVCAAVIQSKDVTELEKIGKEITNKNKELEMFNNLSVDRELKMMGLKREVNDLLMKLGETKKYQITDSLEGGGRK